MSRVSGIGRVFAQGIIMAIAYNAPITFGHRGTARDLNCVGIDFSENGGQSWTSAPFAELDIPLPPARQEVVVQIEASPFTIPDVLSVQQLFIYIGGLFVGYSILRSHDSISFPVARAILTGRPNRMSFVLPNATSPNTSYGSQDLRQLGICLNSVVFRGVS